MYCRTRCNNVGSTCGLSIVRALLLGALLHLGNAGSALIIQLGTEKDA
jgi:hypothetical protein